MLRVVSLYTGIGGLDFGFESAGFETAVAVEIDSRTCETIRLNRPWPVINQDIHNVSSKELMAVAGLYAGDTDVLIGGPPLSAFF
ncbi:DNA cytosine methyltransferase [Acaryochloris sp. 'Moss Beach']|uniref:DNA cytosine methyltransferase n=1 Tax=Acaryochloris sp. 'Moss Beach' TaxID=2740837 RepID=UPI002106B037|nr:DNA cytosine methyltransferase [Acaryochloris sp. 'Moss Beach']UJB68548.1 DNA cytosine methyltransferase [Acaryochloris sp. 'Moss Beach']